MSEMHKEPNEHEPRKPLRLPEYDYGSSGAYSFTICAKDRRPYFKHPVLELILKEEWINLPLHFVGITLDTFMVMADHVHGMLWIDAEVEGSKTLDEIVGGYKSTANVAWLRYIKANGMRGPWKLWQRSFNDHVIRNEQDLMEKRKYILNNPIVAEMKREQKKRDRDLA